MLDATIGIYLMVATLATFAYVGVAAARGRVADRDRYLTGRGSQSSRALALSFFASALGAWILFSPPEVGTFGGLLGISGYAVGQACAIWVFAWLGRQVRRKVPRGSTILQFVRHRFGRSVQAAAGVLSVVYMFVFLVAELTGIGGALALLTGVDALLPIVAVAAVTAAYTAYGGFPASIATDRWQGWLIIGLAAAAGLAVVVDVPDIGTSARRGGAWEIGRVGAETFVVLTIAIVAANLFHQGFWQRVWSARDEASLVRGASLGALLIVPIVALLGIAGAIAAGGGVETPSLALFELLSGLPTAALAAVVVLALALVASSVDTLQNAIASLVDVHLIAPRHGALRARVITVLLTLPAVAIALQGYSVLRLFLVADLLAAAMVFPIFFGLWRRATTSGAIAGIVAGLLGVVVLGWIRSGNLYEGLLLLTLPHGTSLGPFIVAPLASVVVSVAVGLVSRRSQSISVAAAQAVE